jgi:hypothetical protein
MNIVNLKGGSDYRELTEHGKAELAEDKNQ